MSKRRLKPNEQRAWARVAKTVRKRPGVSDAEMPALDDVTPPAPKRPKRQNTTLPHFTPRQPTITPTIRPDMLPDRGRERRIRRGQTPIAGTLDLHGHTQETARGALLSFLRLHHAAGAKCVLVITGKGRLGDGVLRRRLREWLDTHEAKSLLNGYSEAHRKHGGSGAWYLFLRKRDSDKG